MNDFVALADDRTLLKNVREHVKVAKTHMESAVETISLIRNPIVRKEAEALLDFITEV